MFSAPAEFVQLYIDFLLNKSIYRQFAAFYHGFHSVCASDALLVSLDHLSVCCVSVCILCVRMCLQEWMYVCVHVYVHVGVFV